MILDFFSQLLTMLESFFAPFIMILKYLYNDTKRKVQPGNPYLTRFISLIQSSFKLSSLLFIQISEYNVGQADLILTPISIQNKSNQNNPLSFNLINQTEIS